MGVLETCMTLLMAAHLLCVNLAAGGPIIAAWLDWRGCRGDEAAAKAAVYLARWSLAAFPTGAAIGLIFGWLKWDADYRALWLGPLSYKLHWAVIEAVFSLVLLIAWWLWLPGKGSRLRVPAAARGLLALLAATNLLYHFPVLFAVATRLHDSGQTHGTRISGAEFRKLMVAGDIPALWVHVAAASIAVAGVVLLGYALQLRRAGHEQRAARMAMWGGRWALIPSLVQVPVGLWTLATLSPSAQSQIMGVSMVGMLLLVTAILAAFWLVSDLMKVALGDVARPMLIRVMTAMLLTVILMTALEQQTRNSPSPIDAPSNPSTSSTTPIP
jgi:hypothetical protein